MEIEETNDPMKQENADIEMQDDQEDKSKYLSQLLGIKLNKEDLNLFQNMEDLIIFINSIKFMDKKKNEIKEKISEEINTLQNAESFQKLSEDKNKKFSDTVKLKSKTIMYHTAENDELSDTMHAFYFCDKSKQILSDKQTAEYKAIHFAPVYDYPLNLNLNLFGIKDEDNISSYSNLKNVNSQKEETKSKLNKKRNKSKSSKKQSQEKMNNSDEYNNSKNEVVAGTQEEEYCIQNCKYSRKSKGQPMIMCDKCSRWYHTKCLSFTNEQFQKYNVKGKIWHCPICIKMDVEDKNE